MVFCHNSECCLLKRVQLIEADPKENKLVAMQLKTFSDEEPSDDEEEHKRPKSVAENVETNSWQYNLFEIKRLIQF